MTAQELVNHFELEPHPEGGYFKETYRSEKKFGEHHSSTAIYFLLPNGTKSHLHRIQSDEMWHFYLGDPLTIFEILPDGSTLETKLGQDLKKGEKLQYLVKAGHWFGAIPTKNAKYSFVGCTVSPGFEFRDFELGKKDTLLKEYPRAKNVIEILC